MAFSRRRIIVIISLAIYWPALFVATHIPEGPLISEEGVSDKRLHFLAYLILAFLVWCAVNPDRKVHLRKRTLWWVLLAMIAYAIGDELLQGYVGRSCNIGDIQADVAGVVTGLALLRILAFWPAALVIAGTTILGLTNVAQTSLAEAIPVVNAALQPSSYAIFTALWIRNMQSLTRLKPPKPAWLIAALALPGLLLLIVTSLSVIYGRGLQTQDVILAVAGILAVLVAACLMAQRQNRRTEIQEPVSEEP